MPPKKGLPSKSEDNDSADLDTGTRSSKSLTMDDASDFVSKIVVAFTSVFNTSIDRIIDSIDKKFSSRLDTHEVHMFDMNKRMDKLEKSFSELTAENHSLRDQITVLNNKLEVAMKTSDDVEQYSRGLNLLVHGIPLPADLSTETDIETKTVQVLNTNLGLNLTVNDISAIHRLPRHQSTPSATVSGVPLSGQATKPPPVLIQFINKKTRNSTLEKRRLLKGRGFTITEQLTHRRATLLRKATECVSSKRVASAWSHDGKILVKTLTNRTIVISSDSDLDQF